MAGKETYFDVAAGRYAANILWTPELSLDMLGRDWAQLDGPFGFQYTLDTINASTNPTVTTFTEKLSVEFPSDWDLDDTFDDLEVAIRLRFTASLDVAGANFQLTLADDSETYASAGVNITSTSPVTATLLLLLPSAAVPTGRTDLRLRAQALTSDTNNVQVSRSIDPPDCHIWVRYA